MRQQLKKVVFDFFCLGYGGFKKEMPKSGPSYKDSLGAPRILFPGQKCPDSPALVSNAAGRVGESGTSALSKTTILNGESSKTPLVGVIGRAF